MMTVRQKTFLDLLARAEGTQNHPLTQNNGYDVIVSGDPEALVAAYSGKIQAEVGEEVFTIYAYHPFATGRPAKVVRLLPKRLTSTASGRYQLELKWWRAYSAMLDLKDFSPASQDAVALRQISERHALAEIDGGNIQAAIEACSNIWASLPGNNYGQPQKAMSQLLEWYQELLVANQSPLSPA